jgi:hypothetical protein
MAEGIVELKKLSDAELMRRHDELAKNTVVGTAHYLDELRARDNARLSLSVERMTKYIFWLTFVMAVATLSQLFILLWTL